MLRRRLHRCHRIGERFAATISQRYCFCTIQIAVVPALALEPLAASVPGSMARGRRVAGNANARSGVANAAR